VKFISRRETWPKQRHAWKLLWGLIQTFGAQTNWLAVVFLRQRSYALAIQYSELALQLGKNEAKGARLTLAQALSEAGDRERSDQVLNELLQLNPSQDQTRQAKQIFETNRMAPIPATFTAQVSAGAAGTSPKKPEILLHKVRLPPIYRLLPQVL